MTPKNANILKDTYPTVFGTYNRPPMEPFEVFGFQVLDGWFGIIAKLADDLEKFKDVRCVQVKEKFGGLRFYVEPVPGVEWDDETRKKIYDLVENAQGESCVTCESCGDPGEVSNTGGKNSRGWLKCYCAPCYEKDLEEVRKFREKLKARS